MPTEVLLTISWRSTGRFGPEESDSVNAPARTVFGAMISERTHQTIPRSLLQNRLTRPIHGPIFLTYSDVSR
jgi:hypothetical protein